MWILGCPAAPIGYTVSTCTLAVTGANGGDPSDRHTPTLSSQEDNAV
jgi:hypothetical protein